MNNKIKNLKIEFDEEVDGTYIVKVEIGDKTFLVNCQTYMTHDYDESYLLSANNESGSDFSDSGLLIYLEELGFDKYDEEVEQLKLKIEQCAEEHLPENSVTRVLEDKMDERVILATGLFGAYGPGDVSHYFYKTSAGKHIVTSENSSKSRAENQLLGFVTFETEEDFDKWIDEIYGDDHYGDCRVSYRAWKYICDVED